ALGGALELINNTTIMMPGSASVTMTNGQIGTNSNDYTLTNNGLIQGWGVIGSNNTTYEDLSLTNNGTINANSSGNTLSIQGTGTSIINSGTFEATNGGILDLATSAAVQNFGTISAAGAGSTVNLSGDIVGGTLSTSGGGVMQTAVGGVTLDALNLGAITLTDGSTYTAGAAGSSTITNIQGVLNLGTVSGSTLALGGALELINNTTIMMPGSASVTMTNGQIGTNGNEYTLTSNGLIQGWGVIGSNNTTYEDLSLDNTGTINANSSGNTLSIQGTGTSITNAGTFEATGGGTLNLATAAAINNQNGAIVAGNGSTVNISTTVQGGTLTTQGTGVMQTVGTVTLDASTLGAITFTNGSTYLAGIGTLTNVEGQLNLGTGLGSTIQVSGTNMNPGYFRLVGDT